MKSKNQVFCLHFAGGSAYSFDFLLPYLSSNSELVPLELPGRGRRVQEQFLTTSSAASADYTRQIIDRWNREPFVLYGHSMGATLAGHVAQQLEAAGVCPEKIIVTGDPGAGAGTNQERYLLDRDNFLRELREMGGMPADFFKHEALLDLFLPILRADFEVIEGKEELPLPSFRTPVLVIMGGEEEDVAEIDNWKRLTQTHCETRVVEGDHFFIHNYAKQLVEELESCFAKV